MTAATICEWVVRDAGAFSIMGLRLLVQSTVVIAGGLVMAVVARRRSSVTESVILRGTVVAVIVGPLASWALGRSGLQLPHAQVPAGLHGFFAPSNHNRPILIPPLMGVGVWCVISTMLLVRIGIGLRLLRRVRSKAQSASYGWIEDSGRCARVIGVTPPPVLATTHFNTPCLTGYRRPVILMPVRAKTVRHDVLLHELAHVRRKDCLWQLLVHLVTALAWCQPLMWLLSSRVRRSADEVCDDFAIAYGSDRSDYASALVDMARLNQRMASGSRYAVGLATFKSSLSERVVRIMDNSRAISLRTSPMAALLAATLLTAVVVLAGVVGNTAVAFAEDAPAARPATTPKKQPTSIFDFGLQPLANTEPEKGDKEPPEKPEPAPSPAAVPQPSVPAHGAPNAAAQAQMKEVVDSVHIDAQGVMTADKVVTLGLQGTEGQHFIAEGDFFPAKEPTPHTFGQVWFMIRRASSRKNITISMQGISAKRMLYGGAQIARLSELLKFQEISRETWHHFKVESGPDGLAVGIDQQQQIVNGATETSGSNSIILGPGAKLRNLKIAIFRSATPGISSSSPAPAATPPPPAGQVAASSPAPADGVPPIPIGNLEKIVKESAQITAIGYEPEPLVARTDKHHGFRTVPPFFDRYSAMVFCKPVKNDTGVADFEVTTSGYLLLACNFGNQGNPSGGWTATRLKKEDFIARGWQIIEDSALGGPLVNNEGKDGRTQIMFMKHVEKGEKYNLRCNKYDPPFAIVFAPGNPSAVAPPPPAAQTAAPVGAPAKMEPGLLAYEYAALPGEEDVGPKPVDFTQFGPPLGPPQIAPSLHPWQWQGNRNASAHGQLWIEVPGHYSIQSIVWCGRHYLFLDGKLLSEFGKDHVIQELELTKGYHDIVVIAAVTQSPSVNVNWRPPGETKLVPLPNTVIFHDPAAKNPVLPSGLPGTPRISADPVKGSPSAPSNPIAARAVGNNPPQPVVRGANTPAPTDMPRSPLATAALSRGETATKQADAAYAAAIVAAKKNCLKDLDAALKLATQAGNLDEANRIVAVQKHASAQIDEMNGVPNAIAGPPPSDLPKTLRAADALKRDDMATKRAIDARIASITAAKRQCIKDLDGAIKASMAARDLDEANRIQVIKKQIDVTMGSEPAVGSAHRVKKYDGELFAGGDDGFVLYINGELVCQGELPKIAQEHVRIGPGDVIAVRGINKNYDAGFSCYIAFAGEKKSIITHTATWKAFTPRDPLKWYDPAGMTNLRPTTLGGGSQIKPRFEKLLQGDEEVIWGDAKAEIVYLVLPVTENVFREMKAIPPPKK